MDVFDNKSYLQVAAEEQVKNEILFYDKKPAVFYQLFHLLIEYMIKRDFCFIKEW